MAHAGMRYLAWCPGVTVGSPVLDVKMRSLGVAMQSPVSDDQCQLAQCGGQPRPGAAGSAAAAVAAAAVPEWPPRQRRPPSSR